MVSVEAPKVLQYWFTALPMVIPCVQTNVVHYHRSQWTSEGYQDSFMRFITMTFYQSKNQLSHI